VQRLLLLAICLLAPAAHAQGLPPHQPLNATSASRSRLAAEPYRAFAPGRWRVAANLEYGNAIEFDSTPRAHYLLDAEFMRTSLAVSRDVSRRSFVRVTVGATGAYAGFADGFFVWYHKLIHFTQPERIARPKNQFAYQLQLPDGAVVPRRPFKLALDDVRGTVGVRLSPSLQSTLSVTLPTATGPAGYGIGAVSIATVQTAHVELSSRFMFEGTFGLGYTPRHGDLSAYQRTLFASASTGLSLRLWGSQSVFGSLYYHSPYYRGTTLRSLDRRELTADFGWLARGRDGREWHIGFTEDLAPGDAGIDLILSIGRTW
jgi:uncharacterized protein DUF3187